MDKLKKILLESDVLNSDTIEHDKGLLIKIELTRLFAKKVLHISVMRKLANYMTEVKLYLYDKNRVFITDIMHIPDDEAHPMRKIKHREPNSFGDFSKIKPLFLPDIILGAYEQFAEEILSKND
jgi:hypothetical protein